MSQALTQRLARTRRRTTGAALVLAALGTGLAFACEGRASGDAPPQVTALSATFSPTQTIELRASSNEVLAPQFLLQAAPDRLVAIEQGSQDLWELPLAGKRRPRRVGSLRGRGRTRIIGAAGADGRLAVLDLAGTLWLYRSGDAEPFAHSRVAAPRGLRPIALLATKGSTWLLAAQRTIVQPSDQSMRDSATVTAIGPDGGQRSVWAFERVGPAHPRAFFSDFVSATSYGDTVVVTAADPPRIVSWRSKNGSDTADWRETQLAGVPIRRMSQADRDGLAAAAGSTTAALVRDAIRRDYYPAVAGARPDGAGWFVVAGAGAKSFALDYYCRGVFAENLLEHPAIKKIALLPAAVALVRDDLDHGRVLIEYYPYSRFGRTCR